LLSPYGTILCPADGPRFTLQQLASDQPTRRQDGHKKEERRKEVIVPEVFIAQVISEKEEHCEEGRSQEQPP
jgi:hypothetical protein